MNRSPWPYWPLPVLKNHAELRARSGSAAALSSFLSSESRTMTQNSIRMPVETIRIMIDEELLREIDQAARRRKVNRSAQLCTALREYLKLLRIRDNEERDRKSVKSRR